MRFINVLRYTLVVSVLGAMVAASPVVLAETTPERRDFGFGNREIFQFKEDLANLVIRDLNGDGRDDIVFVNNSLSRLEILQRKAQQNQLPGDLLPRLTDVFINQGYLLDQRTVHLKVQDFNGDQRPDLLTFGTHRGIRLFLQGENGGFVTAVGPAIKKIDEVVTVKTADFDKDGFTDILVCRKEAADILFNDGLARFLSRVQIPFTARECAGAVTGDFDGDLHQDLLFYFPKEKLPLRFYRGSADGFGWEHPLDVAPFRRIRKIPLMEQEKDQLVLILQNAVNIRLAELVQGTREKLYDSTAITTLRLGAKGVGRKLSMAWVVHDFNGDGFEDYCVSAPELSRLSVYWGGAPGLQPVPVIVDSLRRAKYMDVDSRGDLYVFSAKENAIACHPAGKLTTFPVFIGLQGKLSAAAVAGNTPGIFYIREKPANSFHFCHGDIDGEKRSVKMAISREQRPTSMLVFPVAARKWGVICFTALGKPSMFFWNGRRLEPVDKQRFRALGSGFTPEAIQVIPFQSGADLMVNEGSVSRLYRYDGSTYRVGQQFGQPDEKATLRFGISAKGPEEIPGYLFYNERGNELVWFPGNGTGKSLSVPFSDTFRDLEGIIAFDAEIGKGILLPCRSETRWIQENVPAYTMKTVSGHSSRAEDPFLWNLFPVRLGSPPRTMAAIFDAENATIELISAQDGKLVEEVSFALFQKSDFSGEEQVRSYEPREVASGDLNGDGIMDLGFLVHDKLVIHLGE